MIKKKSEINELNVELESTIVEVKQEPKYDIEQFRLALCCPNQYHGIIETLPKLTKEEVVQLRDTLRSYTANNMLHFKLEHHFRKALGQE